jgi:hypothetical protein
MCLEEALGRRFHLMIGMTLAFTMFCLKSTENSKSFDIE